MTFNINKQSKKNLFRTGKITTTHGVIHTPSFMPCATVGTVKGISAEELRELGYEIILANAYHLYLRPGEQKVKKLGGIQKFINWHGPILTDSGGYQVFSLGKNFKSYRDDEEKAKLADVTTDGVWFGSHLDGSKHFFTPEKVVEIQKDLGSDIMMVLDECTEYPVSKKRAKASMDMTHTWAKRSKDYWAQRAPLRGQRFKNSKQALFGIVQGSTYKDLREQSVKYISSLSFDGIAVGGVSVGEGKTNMYKVMKWVGPLLPQNKPHYLMGVGEPEDIIEAVKWGFDLFDCVLPTRLGRHGTVWTTTNWKKFNKIDLRKSQYRTDKRVIMKDCGCPACRSDSGDPERQSRDKNGYSKAYLGHLIKSGEMLGMRLASIHNLWIISELMRKIRESPNFYLLL